MSSKSTVTKEIEIAGRRLTFEINKIAPQAGTSVVATLGDTKVLVTVTLGVEKPMNDGGVPLTVDFIERLYAGGIIKGSRWVKREGRPTDEATLTSRLIDRSIRPLFPKDLTNEVQVIVTLLSTDNENDHDIVALNATSVALAVSNIPWNGPIGAVRMGFIANQGSIINPLSSEMEFSDLDLVVSAGKQGVIMIEAGAKQLAEENLAENIEKATVESQKIASEIAQISQEVGADKYPYKPAVLDKELIAEIEKTHKKDLEDLLYLKSSMDKMSSAKIDELKKAVTEEYAENPNKGQVGTIVEYLFKKTLRRLALESKKRIDGRDFDEVRPIEAEVGLLPRTHGSALFARGLTQVLSVVTLASPSLEQWIETAEGMEEKRYIHHYNAPQYSTGETGRMGGLGRREIGHGALAERALQPVIPTEEVFPYTIRVVSEIMSQNGSSSMGSACGSTLALMDAGVPILAPVSGIAMGLIAESDENYAILTDLRGEEDFYGNMDFKVAGTTSGVTAIQLDIKLSDKFSGLTINMIREILDQAHKARKEILDKMLSVIPASRQKVSQYAPKVVTVKVPVEKIGEVIGPGGKIIRNIIATTGATVDMADDGTVTISAVDETAVGKAKTWVEGLVREVQVGEEFEGEVKRILDFGAFVEVLPGKEGLVHVSRMSSGFVSNPNDVVTVGQKVKVKVNEIDEMGRINLSMYWGPKSDTGPQTSDVRPNNFGPRRPFRPSGPRPHFGGGFRGGPRRDSEYRGGRRDR